MNKEGGEPDIEIALVIGIVGKLLVTNEVDIIFSSEDLFHPF